MSARLTLDTLHAAMRRHHAADVKFFRRRPERRHRIRLAAVEEVALARHVAGITAPIPDGIRAFIGIRRAGDGKYHRVIGFLAEGSDTDLDEWAALMAYQHFADHDDATLRRLAAKGARAA